MATLHTRVHKHIRTAPESDESLRPETAVVGEHRNPPRPCPPLALELAQPLVLVLVLAHCQHWHCCLCHARARLFGLHLVMPGGAVEREIGAGLGTAVGSGTFAAGYPLPPPPNRCSGLHLQAASETCVCVCMCVCERAYRSSFV